MARLSIKQVLKHYVTELHDNGSDSALLFYHIHRRIGVRGELSIYIL